MTRTPALTLWRPWTACFTDLPPECAKRIENRGWVTRYRGDVWLHAGKKFDEDAIDTIEEIVPAKHWPTMVRADQHPTGVVAVAELVGVCTEMLSESGFYGGPDCDCGPWAFPGEAHWKFANVRKLATPVPCRGAQQLWALPPDVEAECRAQLVAESAR